MSNAGEIPASTDPKSLIRSRQYRVLLVLAAVVGLIVSAASWLFLEGVHQVEVWVYEDLPGHFGYDHAPLWWPLPWLALAGLLTAFAIVRLPGRGGHVPAEGLKVGGEPLGPIDLPGVALAGLATLGLGLVLGPEGPLIALGTGLGILTVSLVRRDAPPQVATLMAAAGAFAAVSAIFGSPVIGAVLIIEAAGLGGATLTLVLLPGLVAAGIGSLVFVGLGSWSGFSTAAWSLSPFPLPPYGGPTWGDFAWTLVLAIVAAVVTFGVVGVAASCSGSCRTHRFRRPRPLAGLAVGAPGDRLRALRRATRRVPACSSPARSSLLRAVQSDAANDLDLGALALLLLPQGAGLERSR